MEDKQQTDSWRGRLIRIMSAIKNGGGTGHEVVRLGEIIDEMSTPVHPMEPKPSDPIPEELVHKVAVSIHETAHMSTFRARAVHVLDAIDFAALRSEYEDILVDRNKLMADFQRVRSELQAAQADLEGSKNHIEALNSVLREHNEAASIFQPGGRLHKIAGLPLGKSAVVEGFKWFKAQLQAAQAEMLAKEEEIRQHRDALALMQEREEGLQQQLQAAQEKLNQNRCNSGHETLPLVLWDCPECSRITRESLRNENEMMRTSLFDCREQLQAAQARIEQLDGQIVEYETYRMQQIRERDEQLAAAQADSERAWSLIEASGVPKDRAKTISGGIMVLQQRMNKESHLLQAQLAAAQEQVRLHEADSKQNWQALQVAEAQVRMQEDHRIRIGREIVRLEEQVREKDAEIERMDQRERGLFDQIAASQREVERLKAENETLKKNLEAEIKHSQDLEDDLRRAI